MLLLTPEDMFSHHLWIKSSRHNNIMAETASWAATNSICRPRYAAPPPRRRRHCGFGGSHIAADDAGISIYTGRSWLQLHSRVLCPCVNSARAPFTHTQYTHRTILLHGFKKRDFFFHWNFFPDLHRHTHTKNMPTTSSISASCLYKHRPVLCWQTTKKTHCTADATWESLSLALYLLLLVLVTHSLVLCGRAE